MRWVIGAALAMTALFFAVGAVIAREWEAPQMDGLQIVFTSLADNSSYIMKSDGGGIHVLSLDNQRFTEHGCSTNGDYLAFSIGNSLHVLSLATGEIRQATLGAFGPLEALSISDDGNIVTFRTYEGSDSGAGVAWTNNTSSLFGTYTANSYPWPTDILYPPRVSPDGLRLVLEAFVDRPSALSSRIYLTDIDGMNDAIVFTGDKQNTYGLSWIPDISGISISQSSNNIFNTQILDIYRSISVIIRQNELEPYQQPVWSPDRRQIVFSQFAPDGHQQVGVIDWQTGEQHQLTTNEGHKRDACFLTARPQSLIAP
jgi:WD40 repeat protein